MEREPNDTKRAYSVRAWAKCSACRKSKIKCTPQHRVWNGETGQKCESCGLRNLPCGPSFKKDEDPGVSTRRAEYRYASKSDNTTSSPHDTNSTTTSPEFSGTFTTGHWYQSRSTSNDKVGDEKEGKGDLEACSDEKLKLEALAKLDEVNALIEYLIYQSHVSAKACEHLLAEGSYASFFRARIHSLFMGTYLRALELNKREQEDRVLRILFPLIGALERNPSLYDPLKRHALLEIAGIFQQYGHRWECEQLLRRASSMQDYSQSSATDLPSSLLAKSLFKTSETMRLVLPKAFQSVFGYDNVPAELMVTSLHRAAKERNVHVIAGVWSKGDRSHLSAAILNQPSSSHSVDTSWSCRDHVDQELNVEARDFRRRTALFLAADTGLSQVSYFLLQDTEADPNVRDSCGHTTLEVAAMGGHLQVVQYLIAAGALVNPVMTLCASSPLQAAVESAHSHAGLVEYLLENGADPHVRRPLDYKNAIEIAEEKGLHQLAQRMRCLNDQPAPLPCLELPSFADYERPV